MSAGVRGIRVPAAPRRNRLLIAGIVILGLIGVFVMLSRLYVDLFWFREVGLDSVFWTTIRTKIVLGTGAAVVFFALLFLNLLVARRLAPRTRVMTLDQEALERIRQGIEPSLGWLLPLGCGVLAVLVGFAVSQEWQTFLLWRSSSGISFGDPDPVFGRDAGFYVFSLPWLRFLQGWLFSSLVGVTILVALAHLLWGGIRPQASTWADKVTPATRAHLSVLLALIMLTKAWGYWLGGFTLLGSTRGFAQGAFYTDLQAHRPALNLLIIAALVCAVLFLANIRVRLWSLPLVAVGLLALVSVLFGTAYPAFVQRVRVIPQELERERPYIERNIEATRRAFGLDAVQEIPTSYTSKVRPADLKGNDATLSNVRVWRPSFLSQNFQAFERIRQYYEFHDVDVDRYAIDGEERVLMVSGREINQGGLEDDARTWQNQHLVYTHGFGAVAAQVNEATREGAPVFTLGDLPPVGEPAIDQPRIYYGEQAKGSPTFVVVDTETQELDYEGAPPGYRYDGSGGIPVGNVLQRALLAARFGDMNLLISGQIRSESRIMINRDIVTRASLPVPFLTFDADPYLAVVDGRLLWISDAYTSTDRYPYSQPVNLGDATGDEGITGSVNYIRNSVKVTVDAYDGTMTYYADLSEPIVATWDRAFPGLFTPMDRASEDLRAHFRYPENLFQTQTFQYANYHITDPQVFYQRQDQWEVPADPTQGGGGGTTASPAPISSGEALRPYYLLMKIPGDTTERFQLVTPFVPQGRPNMVAWMAASSDPEDYGALRSIELPSGSTIDGPSVVFARINQNPAFAAERTLLGTGGAEVIFGDFLVIPVERSFLYVQPVYIRSNQQSSSSVPELKRVVVANGDAVGIGSTFDEALADSMAGGSGGGDGDGNGDGGGDGGNAEVAQLLQQATQHFAAAEVALRAGDLATYQDEIDEAERLVRRAEELAAAADGGSGTGGVEDGSGADSG